MTGLEITGSREIVLQKNGDTETAAITISAPANEVRYINGCKHGFEVEKIGLACRRVLTMGGL